MEGSPFSPFSRRKSQLWTINLLLSTIILLSPFQYNPHINDNINNQNNNNQNHNTFLYAEGLVVPKNVTVYGSNTISYQINSGDINWINPTNVAARENSNTIKTGSAYAGKYLSQEL